MSMRLAVFGVGAIGGVIGGYLARAGHDVTLVDLWPANIERIKADGLTVTAQEGEFTVQARALHLGEVSAAGLEFDAVLVSVKSYDTRWAATFLEPYLAPGGFLVSAQNSINEDAMADVVGWPRVVGCVITLGAGMYEPGHVQRTSSFDRNAFAMGEPSGLITKRLKEMAEVMGAAGPSRTTTNLWGERWAKLATNCMTNAVSAITGLTTSQLKDDAEVRKLSTHICVEVTQVATAFGVSVEPITGIAAHMFQEALEDPAKMKEVESLMLEHGRVVRAGLPSLAQDVMKGRKTEADDLNGYVVNKGREMGVPTPVNEALLKLAKRLEAGEIEPSISNVQLIEY